MTMADYVESFKNDAAETEEKVNLILSAFTEKYKDSNIDIAVTAGLKDRWAAQDMQRIFIKAKLKII